MPGPIDGADGRRRAAELFTAATSDMDYDEAEADAVIEALRSDGVQPEDVAFAERCVSRYDWENFGDLGLQGRVTEIVCGGGESCGPRGGATYYSKKNAERVLRALRAPSATGVSVRGSTSRGPGELRDGRHRQRRNDG